MSKGIPLTYLLTYFMFLADTDPMLGLGGIVDHFDLSTLTSFL